MCVSVCVCVCVCPQIVHIAVEMAPIAKVGGMGDVVTALGRAVQEEGHDVEAVIPKYDCINYDLVSECVCVCVRVSVHGLVWTGWI